MSSGDLYGELEGTEFEGERGVLILTLNVCQEEWERERPKDGRPAPVTLRELLRRANPYYGWKADNARKVLTNAVLELIEDGIVRLVVPREEMRTSQESMDEVIAASLMQRNLRGCQDLHILFVE